MTTNRLDPDDVISLSRAGLVLAGPANVVTTGDDEFANTGKQYLLLHNDSGAPVTVTFPTPAAKAPEDNVGALAVQDPTDSIGDGELKIYGPFRPSIFNSTEGYVNFTLSDATDVTCDVLEIPNYAANA